MNRTIKSIFLTSCWAISATSLAIEPHKVKPFVTPMQCKTIHARLVSTCAPTRKPFGPAECVAQTLLIDAPNPGATASLFAPHSTRTAPISRHAYRWRCFETPDHAEVLSLDIVGTENGRDEDVWLFDRHGKRLSKRAESRVFRSSAWRQANAGERLTGKGAVNLPAINE